MENAADALKMAAWVLIFVVALSIIINAFGMARQTTDILISYNDNEYYTDYVEQGNTERKVQTHPSGKPKAGYSDLSTAGLPKSRTGAVPGQHHRLGAMGSLIFLRARPASWGTLSWKPYGRFWRRVQMKEGTHYERKTRPVHRFGKPILQELHAGRLPHQRGRLQGMGNVFHR